MTTSDRNPSNFPTKLPADQAGDGQAALALPRRDLLALPEPTPSSQALDLVREELLAMDPRTLIPVNLDVPACSMLVLGVLKDLENYRPALVELCGEEKTKCVDRLDVLARAALNAHAKCRAIDTGANLQPLGAEVAKIRDALLAEVRALVARDVIDPHVLGELTGMHGFKNSCVDVLQLVSVFEAHWEAVEATSGITRAYLARAEKLADRLVKELGERAQAGQSAAADLRRRAFTLLVFTYDDARRLITYLRWKEGDYDRIAPSLFANRGTGRRHGRGAEEAPIVSELTPSAEPVRPGMPGASPFSAALEATDADMPR